METDAVIEATVDREQPSGATEIHHRPTVTIMFFIHLVSCMYEAGASRHKNHLHPDAMSDEPPNAGHWIPWRRPGERLSMRADL